MSQGTCQLLTFLLTKQQEHVNNPIFFQELLLIMSSCHTRSNYRQRWTLQTPDSNCEKCNSKSRRRASLQGNDLILNSGLKWILYFFCLFKVLKFAGFTRSDEELERIDETAYEAQHALIMSTTTATRYYFGTLKLVLNQVSHLIL